MTSKETAKQGCSKGDHGVKVPYEETKIGCLGLKFTSTQKKVTTPKPFSFDTGPKKKPAERKNFAKPLEPKKTTPKPEAKPGIEVKKVTVPKPFSFDTGPKIRGGRSPERKHTATELKSKGAGSKIKIVVESVEVSKATSSCSSTQSRETRSWKSSQESRSCSTTRSTENRSSSTTRSQETGRSRSVSKERRDKSPVCCIPYDKKPCKCSKALHVLGVKDHAPLKPQKSPVPQRKILHSNTKTPTATSGTQKCSKLVKFQAQAGNTEVVEEKIVRSFAAKGCDCSGTHHCSKPSESKIQDVKKHASDVVTVRETTGQNLNELKTRPSDTVNVEEILISGCMNGLTSISDSETRSSAELEALNEIKADLENLNMIKILESNMPKMSKIPRKNDLNSMKKIPGNNQNEITVDFTCSDMKKEEFSSYESKQVQISNMVNN